MLSQPDQKNGFHPLDIYGDTGRITRIFHLFTLIVLLSLIAGVIISLSTGNTTPAIMISAGILPILSVLFLIRSKQFEWASIFLAIVLFLLLTLLATFGLGIHQISNLGFPALLILASLVTRKRTLVFLTICVLACLGWLVFGELAGLYTPTILIKSVPGDFFSASLAILVTVSISRLLTETLFMGNRELQKELRERKLAEEKYTHIFENSIEGIFQSTPEGRFLNVNPAMARMYGYNSPQEMIASITDISSQIYVDSEARDAVRVRLENGEKITGFESYEYRKDGSTLWTSKNAQAIRDENGNVLYYEGTVEDITKRKESEAALQKNRQRLEAFFNQSLDGFFFSIFDTPQQWDDSIDREKTLQHIFTRQHYTDVNNALLEQYGLTREKFLSLTSSEIFAHDPEQGLHLRRQLFDQGHLHTETHERKADGTPAWFEGEYVCLYDQQKNITGFFGIQRDITIRKQAEFEREQLIHELAAKNAESETLRESLASITSTIEFTEIIQQILDQIKRVIPYDSASIWTVEGDSQKLIGGRNLPGELTNSNIEFRTDETNSALPIINGIAPFILNNNVQEELPDFKEHPHTYVNSWLAIPLKTRGKIIGIIALDGMKKGQFNEHHAELAVVFANQVAVALENAQLFSNLQNELFLSGKLIKELESKNAELERFTYTVSHDLKSPLVTINGFLAYLEHDIAANNMQRFKHDSQRIQDAVNKMHALLGELLELSRIGRVINKPQMIPFEEIVNDVMKIMQGQLAARHVTVTLRPNLPAVYGDRQRLVEVLQNLIDNAAKFMTNQPNPLIEIGCEGEEHGSPIFFVRDNGIGIPDELQHRIFGLFDKLDPKSEGTGIGLAIVKRIIEVHEGRIWVQSEAGKGSTFYFTLAGKQESEANP